MSRLAAALARRRALFARIRAEREAVIAYLRQEFPQDEAFLGQAAEEVRAVTVVLGSPRGGTSVFKQVLGSAPGAVALPGEHRWLFTLLGLNHPDHGDMDECAGSIPLDTSQRTFLLDNLLFECRGEQIAEPSRRDWERYAWDWALRLKLQWPDLVDGPAEDLVAVVRDRLCGGLTGPEPAFDVLDAVRAHGVPVDPFQYDLDETLVHSYFPGLPLPSGPPGRTIVEISPFLALRPCHRPRLDLPRTVLVLKASSDAYRIPLIHDLFTGWDICELHLTRNPLASVNGLIDGWQHRSFWQHDLSVHGQAAGSRPDWNFDLCDDWQKLASGDLAELAASQWSCPHRRILNQAKSPVMLRFEDFQAGGLGRRALMDHAAHVSGLHFDDAAWETAKHPRLVNSTAAPAVARWRTSRPHLRELLALPHVAATTEALGYDTRDWARWP
ncbi:MAG TPA: hypothetical protein VGS19_03270 [Streptosporangiaceae bacterium]|nr:hypothetical protein [Streptosporangiaceae bacterium]